MSDIDETFTTTSNAWRSWLVGLAMCAIPALALAACSLAAGDDAVSSESAESIPAATESTRTTDAVTDEPADTGEPADVATTTEASVATTTVAETGTTIAEPDEEPPVAGISFATDIEPIFTSTCANCHTGTGPGTQHIRMDTAGNIAKASAGISLVTRTGFMPPWPASDESVAFDHDWSLTAEEIELIADWNDQGSPLDVPDDHVIAPLPGGSVRLDDADISVKSQGTYDGELGQPDEYRCFIYDPGFESGGFVTGMDFLPDQEQVVHHAVGFIVSSEDRAALEEIDGQDGNGGWTCFGFSPGRSAQLIYGWAPGQSATRYDEGSGLRIDDGDFFVMQTHYHYDVEAPADQSTFDLDFVPDAEAAGIDGVDVQTYFGPAEIPCSVDEAGPLCERDAARDLAIEKYGSAGYLADGIMGICGSTVEDYQDMTSGIASSTCDLDVRNVGEIVSVFGHEHELGATFRMTLNPDTPDERVLLDIPKWDFDWQLVYEPTESIVIERGDTLRIECSWDRSLRDPELEPAYVIWSDGTDDEMCFAMMTTRPL